MTNRKSLFTSCLAAILLCICTSALAQVKVTGTITDSEGFALPGVVVQEAQTSPVNAVLSDKDGIYSITVASSKSKLLFTCVGMTDYTAAVGNRTKIDVVMEDDAIALETIVVTGYQTVNKRELASAVSIVKADDIKLAGVTSIDQMLQGQVAGMQVLQTSGSPGSTAKIRVRGTSSIIGNRSPLWVLDGVVLDEPVEVDHTDLSGDDAEYMVGNAISGVNPNDIESITVLKDASATAIYGVQAANGVIVVTTKKGKSGKPRVSYSANVSFKEAESYRRFNLMSAYQRIGLSRDIMEQDLHYARSQSSLTIGYESLLNRFESKELNREELKQELTKMADMNTDWFGILYRNAVTQTHSASISGGTDQTTYYTSIGYDRDLGTARSEKADRYTVLTKINSWIVPEKLYLGMQLNASLKNNTGYHSSVNPLSYARTTSRCLPCYNEDGSLYFYEPYSAMGAGRDILYYNILDEMEHTGIETGVGAINAKLNFQWNILKPLKYELQASYNYTQTQKRVYADEYSHYVSKIRGYSTRYYVDINSDIWNESALPQGGILNTTDTNVSTWNIRNQLTFNKDFNGHTVSVMGVNEVRSSATDGLANVYYGYMPDRGKTVSPAYTEEYTKRVTSGSFAPTITDNVRNVVSFRGVASYSYLDRYVLNSSVSMDGSNQFGSNPEYRFLPIWSVSAKWSIDREKWMKQQKLFSYLALRLSYGIQGNVDSATSPDLVLKIGSVNSETGLKQSTVSYWPNADLRWEKTTSYNAGLDFAILDNRINGTLDVYHKVGEDMIMNKTISLVNGISTYKINSGNMNNSGVEAVIGGYPVQARDWSVNLQFIYSYNRNVLVKANSELGTITNKDLVSGNALIEGEAIGTLYSYHFSHLDHNTGLPVFYDKDGYNSIVTGGEEKPNFTLYESDLGVVKSGSVNPWASGGINAGIRYKNLHLNASFSYSLGAVNRLPSIYGGSYSRVFDPEMNVTVDIMDRWKQPGDEQRTNIPVLYDEYSYDKVHVLPVSSNGTVKKGVELYDYSTARVCSTDNFRLRSLSLSYNVPSSSLKKVGMNSLSFRLQASNLFLIADKRWQGFDPELGTAATSPVPRTYSIGINATF